MNLPDTVVITVFERTFFSDTILGNLYFNNVDNDDDDDYDYDDDNDNDDDSDDHNLKISTFLVC